MTPWKRLVGCKKCFRTYFVDPEDPPATCPDCGKGLFYKWADRVDLINESNKDQGAITAFDEFREERKQRFKHTNND